jgi:multidrug resistance efflux pump
VSDRHLRPFDTVEAGQVVARLDDRPVLAALATLRARIAVTHGELVAETARWRQDRSDTLRDHEITRQRLVIEIQDLQLGILDRRAMLESDQIELRRIEHAIAVLERLFDRGVENDFTLIQDRLRRDTLATRLSEQRAAMQHAEFQLDESLDRLARIPDVLPDELERVLAPIHAAFRVHEAEINELELRAESLQIRSPIAGMIAHVHARPGEQAVAGLPLLTIASAQAEGVVTYIRERNPVAFEPGARVELRPIHLRGVPMDATVERVGTQVELVPEHHRQSPSVPEWGLPVWISVPDGFGARPGELVRVRFP